MVYYFGYRYNRANTQPWIFSCFRVGEIAPHVIHQLRERQDRDYVSIIHSGTSAMVKSRWTVDNKKVTIPYFVNSDSNEKSITIDPNNTFAYIAFMEWLITQQIDLNNISKADEFTLLMSAE